MLGDGGGAVVLQILGSLRYRTIEVVMPGGSSAEAMLSGDAYCRHLTEKGTDCDLMLGIPESLVTLIAEGPGEAVELLEDKGRMKEAVLRKVMKELGIKHSNVTAVTLPSIGHYSGPGGAYSVTFTNAGVGDVRLKILLDLLPHALGGKRVVVDTSTGHNIYVGAAVRALRDLQVIAGLEGLARADEERVRAPKYGIASLEPVTEEESRAHYLIDEVTAEAFFHYPITRADIHGGEGVKRVRERIWAGGGSDCGEGEVKELKAWGKSGVEGWLKKGLLLYNALAYNAPLAFLELGRELGAWAGRPREAALSISGGLSEYLDRSCTAVNGSEVTVRKRGLSRQAITRVLIALIMADSLMRLSKRLCTEAGACDGFSLNKISSIFPRLYRNLGVSGPSPHILKVEVQRVKSAVEKSPQVKAGGWALLKDVMGGEGGSEGGSERGRKGAEGVSSEKRNFFAHSGFLMNITEVRAEGDDVLVRYRRDRETHDKWRGFLKRPER